MAIMNFMSGLRLNSSSPQSLPMCIDQQMMPTSLPKRKIAKTCYSVQIAKIKMLIIDALSKKHALALKRFRKIIKLRQKRGLSQSGSTA